MSREVGCKSVSFWEVQDREVFLPGNGLGNSLCPQSGVRMTGVIWTLVVGLRLRLIRPTNKPSLVGADLEPVHVPAAATEHIEAQGVVAHR